MPSCLSSGRGPAVAAEAMVATSQPLATQAGLRAFERRLIEPGRRPYHTIIPGMLPREGRVVGPFGVMGGFIQAHIQLVSALVDEGLDPQAALGL